MSETALMSISKIRIRHMVEEGVKGAKLLEKLLENPNKLLSAILIGNNIANIGASAIAIRDMSGLVSVLVFWAVWIRRVHMRRTNP